MSIRVIEASLDSSLQDFGRKNYAHLGIARSGAMDTYSLALANILLGNTFDEAGLELCFKGGKYEFLDEHYFVLSGACFKASLNDKELDTCKVYKAQKGDILALNSASKGFRGYLSLAGGFEVKSFLGSKSSDNKMQVGLYEGRALKNGDILEAKTSFIPFNLEKRTCINPVLSLENELKIRVILGTHEQSFTQKGLNTFLTTRYKVASKSDRMAIYAEAQSNIEHIKTADIISEPNVFGSIQVPKDGFPIILMAGKGSTGGYTTIACVIENDLYLLAQAKIGTSFCFESISIEEAIELYKQRQQDLKDLDKKINLSFEDFVC